MNAVPCNAISIPAVSEDGVEAEEISDAADGGAHGPEDELDQVRDDLLDGLLHAPDDAQDGVVVTALSAEAGIWIQNG